MSLESKNNKYDNVREQNIPEDRDFDLKRAVVNFSSLHNSEKFIYFGTELVPFKDMHPLYKRIMLNEFIGVFNKSVDKDINKYTL